MDIYLTFSFRVPSCFFDRWPQVTASYRFQEASLITLQWEEMTAFYVPVTVFLGSLSFSFCVVSLSLLKRGGGGGGAIL